MRRLFSTLLLTTAIMLVVAACGDAGTAANVTPSPMGDDTIVVPDGDVPTQADIVLGNETFDVSVTGDSQTTMQD